MILKTPFWVTLSVGIGSILILVLLTSQVNHCYEDKVFYLQQQVITIGDYDYSVNRPESVILLPNELREISGLSLHPSNKDILLAIQDEYGTIYYISKDQGKIEDRILFASQEDYEGIEMISNDMIATINSKGDVYLVQLENKKWSSERINTVLTREDDVEGLTYNGKYLILSAKGKGKEKKKKRRLHFFDLESKKVDDEKIIKIDNDQVAQKLDKEKIQVSPSAVTYLPNHRIYTVVASADKCILTIDSSGTILAAVELDPRIYKQPEGICIDENHNIYISSEGVDGSAKLIKLSPM